MNIFLKLLKCITRPHFYKSYLRGVSPLFELEPLFKNLYNIKTIIDIGSNKGQFSILAKYFFPNSKIYSFEPQKKYLNMQKDILKKKNIKYYNFGIGAKNGNKIFYITKREDSSSFLKPIDNQIGDYNSKYKKKVKIDKLENIIKLNDIINPSLIKLDIQGLELEALKGARKLLRKINFIIVEISYQKIYHNQVLNKEIITFLKKKNFIPIKEMNITKRNNKLFQKDILFKNINK